MVKIRGFVNTYISDGAARGAGVLGSPYQGSLVAPKNWRVMTFRLNSVLLVVSLSARDRAAYIDIPCE
jgi:hypothetical protein